MITSPNLITPNNKCIKIEAIIEIAQSHFAKQEYSIFKIRKFLWSYAEEELCFLVQDISKWVVEGEDKLKADHHLPSYRDFYLWYYCNFVPMLPEDALQTPSNTAGFTKELLITRYAVINVKAWVEEDSVDEAIEDWSQFVTMILQEQTDLQS